MNTYNMRSRCNVNLRLIQALIVCRKHHAIWPANSTNASSTLSLWVHCYTVRLHLSNVNLIYSQRRCSTDVPCNFKSMSVFSTSLFFCVEFMRWMAARREKWKGWNTKRRRAKKRKEIEYYANYGPKDMYNILHLFICATELHRIERKKFDA